MIKIGEDFIPKKGSMLWKLWKEFRGEKEEKKEGLSSPLFPKKDV